MVQAYRPFWDGTSLRLKPLPLGLDANGPVGEATGAQPSRLRRFEGLGEDVPCSGVAISGARPCMLIAARQTLVAHPLALGPAREGQPVGVAAFTPFHNVNCPFGFITSTGLRARREGVLCCLLVLFYFSAMNAPRSFR